VPALKRLEDETLYAVTEPSESPFIFTYKKSRDDDSVSQITSSLAENSSKSAGSFQLQNVPTNLGPLSRTGMNNRTGLSWMNNNSGFGSGRSRMINRKGGMAGPYGRRADRASGRSSSNAVGGGGRKSRGSSNSGSGSVGSGGGASFDGTSSNLDEIAYALNADCATNPAGRKSQRPLSARRPPSRGSAQYLGNSREINIGGRGEDLSTVESADGFECQNSQQPFIDTNMKSSNVSRLGMGGVSTGAQSVSETTALSGSTTSSIGLFQSISLVWWKAHHTGRFLFPTSPAVTRRKKFDRSDSMDELDDIMMEEGSKTLPHRKSRGIRHHGDDEDEDEIDYFSRAMSISNNHGTNSRKTKKRNKYCWKSSTVRLGALFFLFTVTFTLYRMPERENADNHPVHSNDGGRFRDAGGRFVHDPPMPEDGNNGQVLDYATGAMVDSDSKAYHNNNDQGTGIVESGATAGRLGQPIEASLEPFAGEQQQQQLQQHFLVNGNVRLPAKFSTHWLTWMTCFSNGA